MGISSDTFGGTRLIVLSCLLTAIGCHATMKTTWPPQAPARPATAPTAASAKPAATPAPTPVQPQPPANRPLPAVSPVTEDNQNADDDMEIASEGNAAEGAAPSADSLQKEALELCQLAAEQTKRGEMEEALVSLDRAYELMIALPNNGDGSFLQAKEDIRRLVAQIVLRLYGRRAAANAPLTSWDLGLPLIDNDHVRREITCLTTIERNEFIEGYRRSGLYRPMILTKLREAGLPSHLSWLPLVESWFKVRALSRAGAFGLWQFIASTGQRYGLGRDRWIDERLDPEKSTDAAIAYLTELHGLFGEWPKALAAYNCGEARLLRLQKPSGERYFDFWDLYQHLPLETRRYVPRLIAALLIIENPAKYGMSLPAPYPPDNDRTIVRVARPIELARLDLALGLEKGALQALNPELRQGATPQQAYDLRVPKDKSESILARMAELPEWRPPVPQYIVHRVRRGETLSQIANRYRASTTAIMHANHLRRAGRIWPGQRLRIPVRH